MSHRLWWYLQKFKPSSPPQPVIYIENTFCYLFFLTSKILFFYILLTAKKKTIIVTYIARFLWCGGNNWCHHLAARILRTCQESCDIWFFWVLLLRTSIRQHWWFNQKTQSGLLRWWVFFSAYIRIKTWFWEFAKRSCLFFSTL